MSGVLFYILITIVTLLLLILFAPIHFNFKGEYSHNLNFQGRVGWAGGLLSLEMIRSEGSIYLVLGLLSLRKTIPARERKTPIRTKPLKEKRRINSIGDILSVINRQLFTAVKVVFSKLVRALHLGLNISGTYGFDDPALTGVSMGVIAVLNRGGSSMDLKPDFTGEVVDIRGTIRGWFFPLQILAIGVAFLLKKPVRLIWWSKIKFKRKQKEAVQYA